MSYKKKNRFLLITVLAMLPILYLLSIKKTIAYKNRYSILSKERKDVDKVASRILYLKQQNIYLDSILKKENVSVTNSFQQILLKRINTFKKEHPIDIIKLGNPIQALDNNVNGLFYPIEVKGDFNTLLQFLNYLEKEGLCEIKTFSFLKKKDYRRNKEYLSLELLLKKIITN